MSGLPGPVTRFIALLFGPGYFWLLAVILTRATGYPLYGTIIAVFLGATVLAILMAMLLATFYDPEKAKYRWSISTLMQLTATLAIFLAYIGQFTIQLSDQPVSWYGISVVAFYSSFFIVMTTIVILFFTDALLVSVQPIFTLLRSICRKGN